MSSKQHKTSMKSFLRGTLYNSLHARGLEIKDMILNSSRKRSGVAMARNLPERRY